MTSTTRLKFAWARGARIQVFLPKGVYARHEPHWSYVGTGMPGTATLVDYQHRIDPDDAHLEYGPLSSELRRLAIHDELTMDFAVTFGEVIFEEPLWEGIYAHFAVDLKDEWCWGSDESRMYYLFIAEMMADEGL